MSKSLGQAKKDKILYTRDTIQKLTKLQENIYKELSTELGISEGSESCEWLFDFIFNTDTQADNEYYLKKIGNSSKKKDD